MIKWDDSFMIGIETIDDQHKYLFELCRKLEIFLEIPTGVYKVKDALELVCCFRTYITFHFYYEEMYFHLLDYPDLASHKLEHEEFKKHIVDVNINNFYNENYNELKTLLNLSYDLIFNHIKSKDFKLKNLVKEEN
ncbi:bacteriohemerythrin [Clostridium uliginosum]|uniref:Hemerythrin n=1 Tax=Clostridium uliginosum TaxID=119641 RepID=A0A1I1S530_9CLOT|nr:hemerythrin domain-containing protein [Clostridium uliginosum]SFD41442.1 hemerythrin [Clostridium uliginosum]